MNRRDFAAELVEAREAQDWDAHERIWEERRVASVEDDEASLNEPEPDPTAPREVTILADRLPEAQKLLDKLVRKAARYGNTDVRYTVGEVFHTAEVRRNVITGREVTVPGPDRVTLTVEGGAPRVGPFEFLAKVEHSPEGNVVDIVPGRTVDIRFRSTPSSCEHCQTTRQRKETYVVRNVETGAEVQVGSTCILDYTGRATPAGLAQRFAFFADVASAFDEDSWGSGGGWGAQFPVDEVLALSAAAIRKWGWCSKGQAQVAGGDLDATAFIVASYMDPPRRRTESTEHIFKRNSQLKAELRPEADMAYGRAILDWLSDGGAGDGDYGHNLKVVCARGIIEGKRIGLVASAVQAYERAQEREVRRTQELAKAKDSQWVGIEGQRLRDVEVVQRDMRTMPDRGFGPSVLVKFTDEAGNVMTWFKSDGYGTGLQNGERAILTGTVKRHSEYNGARETQLSRCILTPAN
jgi:hypothetical protein